MKKIYLSPKIDVQTFVLSDVLTNSSDITENDPYAPMQKGQFGE